MYVFCGCKVTTVGQQIITTSINSLFCVGEGKQIIRGREWIHEGIDYGRIEQKGLYFLVIIELKCRY